MEVYRDQSRRKLIFLNLEFPEIRKSRFGGWSHSGSTSGAADTELAL